MNSRDIFCLLLRSKVDRWSVWGQKGPTYFDCSGLVTWALYAATGKDLRGTHNSQRLHDESPALDAPPGFVAQPGDLCFYGADAAGVSHVAVWLSDSECISADGATPKILNPKDVEAHRDYRVRIHKSPRFRGDLPYFAIHRNQWVAK